MSAALLACQREEWDFNEFQANNHSVPIPVLFKIYSLIKKQNSVTSLNVKKSESSLSLSAAGDSFHLDVVL